MTDPLRVLVVEDSEIDYQVLVATLRRDGFPVEASRVETAGSMRETLRDAVAYVLSGEHPKAMEGEA